jgi:hypothetical protein
MTNFPEQHARACVNSVYKLGRNSRKNIKVMKVTFWEMTKGKT